MSKDKQFNVALSTIAGSSFPNIIKVFKGQKIHPGYSARKFNAFAISLLNEPLRWWEEIRYGNAVNKTAIPDSPVFILGHWRSGTTLLHNMLCEDPQFAYITTYQGVFPNQLLGSKWLLRNIMKAMMPEKRPSDNMALSPEFPQEEEFAFGNTCPYSLYNFWYFPDKTFEFYNKYIRFADNNEKVRTGWISSYKKMMRKSLYYHGKKQFISKNPPHTGRIKILLEAFPNAKFIYIYRNPITVFESTKKLITSTIPTLTFQNISETEIEQIIFRLYKEIVGDYEATKHLIPKGNLVEVKFEDFEKDTVGGLKNIYNTLSINGYQNAEKHFIAYANAQKKYQKNTYSFSRQKVEEIKQHWNFSIEQYGYELPEGMVLV